jgi:hypothetical protein
MEINFYRKVSKPTGIGAIRKAMVLKACSAACLS